MLKTNEMIEFSKLSNLPCEVVSILYDYFKTFSKLSKDDGIVDYDELCIAYNVKPNSLIKEIFKLFDANNDGSINFREFIIGISNLMFGPAQKQVEYLFKILDTNHSGKIKRQDLETLIDDCFQMVSISIQKDTINEIISRTFDAVGGNEMNMLEFKALLENSKILLKCLDFNESQVTSLVPLKKKKPC